MASQASLLAHCFLGVSNMRFDAKKLHIIMITVSTVISALAAGVGAIGANEGALLGASLNSLVPLAGALRA